MIKTEQNIVLNPKEYKFIRSGWGNDVADNICLKKIIYESDGELVDGFLATPKNISGKLPAIIWNRGGFKESGKLDDFLAYGLLGEIASWGYAVFASQYRKNDEFGGSDLNDIINIIRIAESSDFVNPVSIGMEGWSRGGMMTYLALTGNIKIKCAVIISGISNLKRNFNNIGISKILTVKNNYDYSEIEKELEKRSAVIFFEKISKNTSILVIHGDKDELVSYLDSTEIYSKLSANKNANYELKIIKDGDHFLKSSKKEVSLLRRNWFDKYLKK